MSEEKNNNTEMVAAGRSNAADDTKEKLSADAGGLGPMHAGSIVIGRVDEIVGEGGVEKRDYVPIGHELCVLLKYWVTTLTDLDFDSFLYASTGSSEWRTRAFARRRLNRLLQVIGKEAGEKAYHEAEAEFRKRYKVSDEEWRIFTMGTEQEVREFQDKLHREMLPNETKTEVSKVLDGSGDPTTSEMSAP